MNNFFGVFVKYRWSLLVFLLGIMLSSFMSYDTQRKNTEHIREIMEESLDAASDSILTKVKLYQYGLRGARGSVLTLGEHGVSRESFYRYSLTRDVDVEFPGARGFGFIRRVPVNEIDQFLAKARADGWPEFSIRELTPHSGERYVIQYIEPVERNKAAVGLDIASERNRYGAAKSAMQSGEVRLTGPITLVQASGLPQQSFLILMPLYRSMKTPETVSERERQAFGWSYAPLIITDILSHIRVDTSKFILTLEDVTEPDNPVRFFSNAADDNTGSYPLETVQQIYGRSWRFNFSAQPAFIQSMQLQSPGNVGLFGVLSSLLLTWLVSLIEINQRNKQLLFKQQATLVSLVESSADGIISCTLDGKVLTWNKGAEALFGYARDEAVSKKLQSLIAQPMIADELSVKLKSVATGQSITNYDTVYPTKNGALIDVSITLSPIYAPDGGVVAASKTVRDISAQKIAEAKVHELNANLEAKVTQRTAEIASLNLMFTNVLAAASDFSIIATDDEGVIQLFNRGAELLLGYSADEVMGQTPLLFHSVEELTLRQGATGNQHSPMSGPNFLTLISLSHQDNSGNEWRYLHKNGRQIEVSLVVTAIRDDEQKLVGYLFIATDITLQKQKQTELIATQQQLLSQTEQLLLAYKVAELGIWEWRLDNNSLDWSDKMFELYEQPSELNQNGLNYSHWESRVHPDDREATTALLHDAVDGIAEYASIFRLQLPSGKVRYIQGGAYVLRDALGAALRVVGINRDITAERELELQLRESKQNAEAANSAKSMFLANMSHEIRTPMNAVLGMLQLIQSTELSMQQHDYTNKAQIAAKSLLNLINDILDYSKIEAGKLELEQHAFSTEALLRELAVVLSPSLGKKNVELLFDIDRNLPDIIEGDRLRLQQVLVNLASNAIKFTADGEIIIQLTQLQSDNTKTRIRFSVLDTGIGISPSQQKRIFDGFTQAEASTTRQYGGTGLGLVISKRIIELMGGELQLQSTPGQGSCFWFDVEFAVASIADVDVDVDVARSIAIGPDTTVLIVDDNESALEILQKTVEQLGAHVLVARSGEEALASVEHCVKTKQKLHAVLMDYRMPGMNGLEVAQCIRAKSGASSLPVVIMVSAFGRDEIIKAQTTGVVPFAAFLTKPVTPVQLGVLLERSLSGETFAPSLRVQPKQSTSPLHGLHLLLVEDQEFNRIVASELLENEGAVIDIAVGGLEGIEAVTQGDISYDLVLMDVQMPMVDGLEATRRIRADARFASLPIIAMTANVCASDQEDCIKAGMNGHLAKPFDLDKVIETILYFTDKTRNRDSDLAMLADNAENSSDNPAEQIALQQLQFEQKDLATLLKPFGGKEVFYRRLLQVFEANFASQLVSLQEKIAQNDHQEVLALLHSMKGTSGTIGLATLYQTICQLEIQCKQHLDQATSTLNTLYTGLTERIDFIAQRELSDIHQLLAQQDELKAEVVFTPATFSKDDIINMLSPLKPYLEAGNLKALTLAEQLKEKFVGHEQLLIQTGALFEAIEQLKFDHALLELSKLST